MKMNTYMQYWLGPLLYKNTQYRLGYVIYGRNQMHTRLYSAINSIAWKSVEVSNCVGISLSLFGFKRRRMSFSTYKPSSLSWWHKCDTQFRNYPSLTTESISKAKSTFHCVSTLLPLCEICPISQLWIEEQQASRCQKDPDRFSNFFWQIRVQHICEYRTFDLNTVWQFGASWKSQWLYLSKSGTIQN